MRRLHCGTRRGKRMRAWSSWRQDGWWMEAGFLLHRRIRVDIHRRHLFRYTLDRSNCLRHERITYTGKDGGGAMAVWHCDMSDGVRLTTSHHRTSTCVVMPAPSRPSTRRIPRSITPQYRTHYKATARRIGIKMSLHTRMVGRARRLWGRRHASSSSED